MKYRIVETEAGTYRIQKSLFGLSWAFVKEKYYKRDLNDNFKYYFKCVKDYNSEDLAKESMERMKNKVIYKGYHILYGRDNTGQLSYFIPTKPNKRVFAKYEIIQKKLEDVYYWVDIMDSNRIHDKNAKKIKRILA